MNKHALPAQSWIVVSGSGAKFTWCQENRGLLCEMAVNTDLPGEERKRSKLQGAELRRCWVKQLGYHWDVWLSILRKYSLWNTPTGYLLSPCRWEADSVVQMLKKMRSGTQKACKPPALHLKVSCKTAGVEATHSTIWPKFFLCKVDSLSCLAAHVCNLRSQVAEARGSGIQDHP